MARTRLATDLKQSCSGCVLTDPVLFTSCDGHSRCRPWVVRRDCRVPSTAKPGRRARCSGVRCPGRARSGTCPANMRSLRRQAFGYRETGYCWESGPRPISRRWLSSMTTPRSTDGLRCPLRSTPRRQVHTWPGPTKVVGKAARRRSWRSPPTVSSRVVRSSSFAASSTRVTSKLLSASAADIADRASPHEPSGWWPTIPSRAGSKESAATH